MRKTSVSVMRMGRFTLFDTVIIFIIIMMTLLISPFITDGDQVAYRKTYEGIRTLSLINGYAFYALSLSSLEIGHFILIWLFSHLQIGKIFFEAFSNTLLAFSLISLLKKWNVSKYVITLIVLSNFYFIVLYFSAERLKISVTFLLFSIKYINNFKKNLIFSFLAITSHVQTTIIYGSIIFKQIFVSSLKFYKTARISKYVLFLFLFFLIVILGMSTQILRKLQYYSNDFGVSEIIKSVLFLLMSLFYSKNKMETILVFIPIIFVVLIIGGARVNMMAYFIFLYYALNIKRGLNFGVLMTSIYFSYKSINFISNIFIHGNGFY